MSARQRVLLAVAAVSVLALISVTVVTLTGDPTDPRRAWAAAAEELCVAAHNEAATVRVPADTGDEDAARSWAARRGSIERDLAHALAALDTPNGDVADMSAVAAGEAATRAALYEAMAAPGSVLPDPDTGEGGFAQELIASYAKVDAALTRWGAPSCGRTLVDSGVISELEQWTTAVELACAEAADRFAEADTEADWDDPGSYLEAVAVIAHELLAAIDDAGDAPEGAPDGMGELTAAVAAARDAANDGDLDAVRAANDQWRAAAPEQLPACARGIVAAPGAAGSGLVADPAFVPTGEGLDGGAVADAGTVLGYLIPQMLEGVRPEPDGAFGTRRLVAAIVGGDVTAVPGQEPASPTAVSVGEPRLVDPAAEPSELNFYVVGVAVADLHGNCAYGQLVGYPQVHGYSQVSASGSCTGDVAAAAPPA